MRTDTYCQKCGKRIPDGKRYCPRCGWMPNNAQKESMRLSVAAKPPMKKKKRGLKGLLILLAVLAAVAVAAVSVIYGLLGNVNRVSELGSDMGVNEQVPATGVQNIALFGLDTRAHSETGHSDAIIILSIDRDHNAIKMTSIARDTLVAIDGYGQSKLTHAFWWGGKELAVKTINQNFGMNIMDCAYVNFYEFVELIDYVGGVTVDVDASERNVMNNYYAPELIELGFDYTPVPGTGLRRLTGAQALAYSRNRYSDSDIGRGNRQKEVLEAMFREIKAMSPTQYPAVIGKVLSMCHTTLTKSEMLGIGTWAVTASPTVETLSLPDEGWTDRNGAVVYDLAAATDRLHRFIYEPPTTDVVEE